jgi:hypothetical protein
MMHRRSGKRPKVDDSVRCTVGCNSIGKNRAPIQRLLAPLGGLELRLSVESPQGKGASGGQTRVYVVNEVKAAVAIGPFGRWFLPESKSVERATIVPQHDLNDHQILVTLSIDRKDFGKNWRHLRLFPSSTMIEMTFGYEAFAQGLLFLSCFDLNPLLLASLV